MSHAIAAVRARARPRAEIHRHLPLALVIALASLIGFWGIDQANVGADELIYQDAALRYLEGDFSANAEHPPVGKYLLGAWQLVFGAGVVSGRALMGVVLVCTAVIAFLWTRAAFGLTTALVSATLLITTHRVVGSDFIDRQILLDPFSVMFGLAGLATLWQWERSRRFWLAPLAGTLAALALVSKASAATFVLGALACVPWRELRQASTWRALAAFAAAGLSTCLVAYAPLGGIAAVLAMVEAQSAHAQGGHVIVVAGETYLHAPWFAMLWFAGEAVGWFALIVSLCMALTGALLRWRARATRVLVGAGAGSLVALSTSPVALPHYAQSWLWALALLAGVGIVELARRARSGPARAITAGAAVALAVGPITGAAHVLTIEPTGIARVDAAIEADPAPDGAVLTLQLSPWITDPNVDAPVTTDPAAPGITAVAVGSDLRLPADPALLRAIRLHEEPVLLDDVELYVLDEELAVLLERSP